MSFDLHHINNKITRPEAWLCDSCEVSHDVWVCLSCGNVGCGRESEGHALKHFKDTKHPISLCLNSKHCFCYLCDDWVIADNKHNELELIRRLLNDVQSQEFSASYTRSGKAIRKKQTAWSLKEARGHRASRGRSIVSYSVQLRQRLRDKYFTATRQYELYIQRKYLNSWRKVLTRKAAGAPAPAGGPAPLEDARTSTPSRAVPVALGAVSTSSMTISPNGGVVDPRAALTMKSPSPESYRANQQIKNDGSGKAASKRKRVRKGLLLPGRVGMTNLGNTCYINSVFQALSNTRAFWKYFIRFRHVNFADSSNGDDAATLVPPPSGAGRGKKRGRRKKEAGGTTDPDILLQTPSNARPPNPLKRQSSVDIYELVKSKANKKENTAVSLCLEIHNLLRVLWSGRWAVVTPNALVFAIWRFVPCFRSFRQQDAHEFFSHFIERLQEELLDESKRHEQLAETAANEDLLISPSVNARFIEHSGISLRTKDVANNMFVGKYRQVIRCDSCKNTSERVFEFKTLNINIPVRLQQDVPRGRRGGTPSCEGEGCTIHDCVNELIAEERMTGDSKYHCDHCECKQDASKTVRISKLPAVLVFHINRTRWDLRGTRKKLMDQVSFPLHNLDLEYACWDECFEDSSEGDDNAGILSSPSIQSRNAKNDSALYSLSAVVSHHGSGMDKGHYSALCLDADSDTWIHYNDRKVSISSDEDVQDAQAYLLFYERTQQSDS